MTDIFDECIYRELKKMGSVIQQEEQHEDVLQRRVALCKNKIHERHLGSIAHHVEAAAQSGGLVKFGCDFTVNSIQKNGHKIVDYECHPLVRGKCVVHTFDSHDVPKIINAICIVAQDVPVLHYRNGGVFLFFFRIHNSNKIKL
jgi:hypothetical protein